jgi:hypothetical protein
VKLTNVIDDSNHDEAFPLQLVPRIETYEVVPSGTLASGEKNDSADVRPEPRLQEDG